MQFLLQNSENLVLQSIQDKVINRIRGWGKGAVFTPSQFFDLGSQNAIGIALARLEKKSAIRRLARGLFDFPKEHAELGLLSPSAEAIAKAIAGKNAIRIQPSGAYAANLLGLSEQVPAKIVFLTDGVSKHVQVGKMEIILRKTTPKNMQTAGRLSGLLIQAFRFIRKAYVDDDMIDMLKKKIPLEDRKKLMKDISYAPAWISDIFRELSKE